MKENLVISKSEIFQSKNFSFAIDFTVTVLVITK